MSQTASSRNNALLAFFAGAAAGALTVALTSSRLAQVRQELAGLGRRVKGQAGLLAERGGRAWEAFKEDAVDPHPATGQDMRGQAAGVWQDTSDRTEMVAQARQTPGGLASDLG
jgi:hypothetical protein